jgi:hypothetical protein
MRTSLFLIVVTMACLARAGEDERLVGMLGAKENYETVRQAERVEACPLIIDWAASAKEGKGIISSEGAYVDLSESDARLLKAKLVNSASYLWGTEEKECSPDYHLRVRLYHRNKRVDVDFCFGCDILQFHRGTEMFAEKNFDPTSKELFSVFLRLFPSDPVMLHLKERRESWEKKRKKEANQSSQRNAMDRPFSVFESRSSRG